MPGTKSEQKTPATVAGFKSPSEIAHALNDCLKKEEELEDAALQEQIDKNDTFLAARVTATTNTELLAKNLFRFDNEPLAIIAAKRGYAKTVLALFEQDPQLLDVETCDTNETMTLTKISPLHELVAAYKGPTEIITELLKRNPAFLTKKDSLGQTLAHWAASYEKKNLLLFLQKEYPDSLRHEVNSGETPLHFSGLLGDTETLLALWEKDPELLLATNPDGETPLHIAALKAQEETLLALWKKDPKLLLAKDSEGMMPLHLVVTRKKPRKLSRRRCNSIPQRDNLKKKDKHRLAKHNKKTLDILLAFLEEGLDFSSYQDEETGATPLHYLVRDGDIDILEALLAEYPDLTHVTDNNGNTLAHWAVMYEPLPPSPLTIATSLFYATPQREYSVHSDFLAKHPTLLLAKNKEFDTPIDFIFQYDSPNSTLLHCLNNVPALLDGHSIYCETLMKTLISLGKNKILEQLLTQRLKLISIRSSSKETLAHWGADYENIDFLRMLTKLDPEILSIQDNDGKTPKIRMKDRNHDVWVTIKALEDWVAKEKVKNYKTKAQDPEKLSEEATASNPTP